jgi:hypothetical protein
MPECLVFRILILEPRPAETHPLGLLHRRAAFLSDLVGSARDVIAAKVSPLDSPPRLYCNIQRC